MREMVKKGSLAVDVKLVGAEACFKRGYVHKVYNGNQMEVFVFASPIHEW